MQIFGLQPGEYFDPTGDDIETRSLDETPETLRDKIAEDMDLDDFEDGVSYAKYPESEVFVFTDLVFDLDDNNVNLVVDGLVELGSIQLFGTVTTLYRREDAEVPGWAFVYQPGEPQNAVLIEC